MGQAETYPSWGWNVETRQKKLFQLKPGEPLPHGYVDSPAKVPGTKDYEDAEAARKKAESQNVIPISEPASEFMTQEDIAVEKRLIKAEGDQPPVKRKRGRPRLISRKADAD